MTQTCATNSYHRRNRSRLLRYLHACRHLFLQPSAGHHRQGRVRSGFWTRSLDFMTGSATAPFLAQTSPSARRGLARSTPRLQVRVSVPTTPRKTAAVSQANARWNFFDKHVVFGLHGFGGSGSGRYGAGQLSDLSIHANGTPDLIKNLQGLASLEWHGKASGLSLSLRRLGV